MARRTGGSNALVVVVGRSKVNYVVISKIVEYMGLRAVCGLPEQAATMLQRHAPGLVILDISRSDRDWNDVLQAVSDRAVNVPSSAPGVIALVTEKPDTKLANALAVADLVISKPVTQDRLQPAVEKLLARHPACPLPMSDTGRL
ncbi:PleD family two-component system response regulator [Mesorhizobium xinjiangense]|uniref:response regulator n=1 Tax=Mesorhizobium xinjiangense TaxID=2678685 RepID=UPI0018DBAA80|nr:response regulator [Mesorhizobium xinjiangense]